MHMRISLCGTCCCVSYAELPLSTSFLLLMAAKDTKEEKFPSLKDADTSDNAKIHGVVACLKKGKSASFFNAKITDGDTEM